MPLIRSSRATGVSLAALFLLSATGAAQSPAASAPAGSPAASACPSPGAEASMPAGSLAPATTGPAASLPAASIPAASITPASMAPASAAPAASDGAVASGAPSSADPCAGAAALVLLNETTADEPIAFTENTMEAPAATLVRAEYLNDSPVPHNIVFFEGSDATAPVLGRTEVETGPDNLQVTEFTTPTEPGSYFFFCEVHPTLMTGTLEVTAG